MAFRARSESLPSASHAARKYMRIHIQVKQVLPFLWVFPKVDEAPNEVRITQLLCTA